MAEILRLEHLEKSFGTHAVLRGVDLRVEKGEVLSVIGSSGSGKSTMLRCINLLETPTAGKIYFEGKDISAKDMDLCRYRARVGMVFQQFNLFGNMSVLANCVSPQTTVLGRKKPEAEEIAREYLARVGMSAFLNARPAQLSGGQKQRVAIARALATNPKVLLCDEATSALDPTTTESILELLRDLNRRLGVTVVVITHEMRVVERICSRVAIIADSRIAELGPVQEVFLHPQTEAAKRLVLPSRAGKLEGFAKDGENRAVDECRGSLIRLAFDGETTDRPIIADMILSLGAPVSIVYADTRSIEGRLYGHTVLQLPSDPETADKMRRWLENEGIIYTEEE